MGTAEKTTKNTTVNEETVETTAPATEQKDKTKEHRVAIQPRKPEVVKIDSVVPNPLNKRPLRQKHIEELKSMIRCDKEMAIRMPIIVREKNADEQYVVVSGHHRLQAYRELGFKVVVVMVGTMDDKTAAIEILTSNRSQPITMLDMGRHYFAMKEAGFEMDQKTFAAHIGKTEANVSQSLKVARLYEALPGDMKDAIDNAEGTSLSTQLLYIAGAPEDIRESLVQTILTKELTAVQVKDMVEDALAAKKAAEEANDGTLGLDVEPAENNKGKGADKATKGKTNSDAEEADDDTDDDDVEDATPIDQLSADEVANFMLVQLDSVENGLAILRDKDGKDAGDHLKAIKNRLTKLTNMVDAALAKS